jgi:hypothetical protein
VRALRNELSVGEQSAFLMLRIGSAGNLKQTTKQSSSKQPSKLQANHLAKRKQTTKQNFHPPLAIQRPFPPLLDAVSFLHK